jgi:hypothetical protein
VQPYVAAELRAGLLAARVERLLEQVKELYSPDLFLLDTPPSFFGLSGLARTLVKKHDGAEVLVVTPTRQDLGGAQDMLQEMLPASGQPPTPGRLSLVLNRHGERRVGEEARQDIVRLFSLVRADAPNDLEDKLRHELLQPFNMVCILDYPHLMRRIAGLAQDHGPRPSVSELLSEDIETLATNIEKGLSLFTKKSAS